MAKDTEHGQFPAEQKTPVEARQGVISGRIVTVLGASLSLAIVAMVVSYMVF